MAASPPLETDPRTLRAKLRALEAARAPRSTNVRLEALAEACFRIALHPGTAPVEAIQLLQRAAACDPANPKPAYHLARLYFVHDELGMAGQWLQRAFLLCPTSHRIWVLSPCCSESCPGGDGATRTTTPTPSASAAWRCWNSCGRAPTRSTPRCSTFDRRRSRPPTNRSRHLRPFQHPRFGRCGSSTPASAAGQASTTWRPRNASWPTRPRPAGTSWRGRSNWPHGGPPPGLAAWRRSW